MGAAGAAAKTVVLVVEDEPILRMMAADMAADAGFEVVEAANADEAIELLEVRTDIRIMFCDIQMPGSMDGARLAAVARHRWPPVEIIMTSGQIKEDQLQMPDRAIFFSKPYRPEQVVAAMTRMAG